MKVLTGKAAEQLAAAWRSEQLERRWLHSAMPIYRLRFSQAGSVVHETTIFATSETDFGCGPPVPYSNASQCRMRGAFVGRLFEIFPLSDAVNAQLALATAIDLDLEGRTGAAAAINREVELDPQSAEIRAWQARLTRSPDRAIEYVTKAIELATDSADRCRYFEIRAHLHMAAKHYQQAIDDHSRAIEICPNNADRAQIHDARGELLYWTGRVPEALDDFDAATAVTPVHELFDRHRRDAIKALERLQITRPRNAPPTK